jgi:Neprosin
MNQNIKLPEGPFRNEEVESNVKPYQRVKSRPPINHARFQREIVEYFERRLQQLQIVKTTTTPRGQTIDWIPIESQHPRGEIASPPPTPDSTGQKMSHRERPELLAKGELEYVDVERGPKGTVPLLRKKLQALGYTKSLKKYLSKSQGHRIMSLRGMGLPAPEEDGNHRYAASGQSILCFGGEGQLSCFDPYVETSDDFSLIQIGLSNRDLGFLQTVEAGWQESQDIMGDWVPHLFTYYTTNGYTNDDDNQGGYNTDVDGWVQYDDLIFPGTTFTPYSTRGGDQYKMTIKYQLYQGNWWLACQGRWAGYYPASLFMGNQSVFSTLGDHADNIQFFGEIFDSDDVPGRTSSDMGSGYFAEAGWTRAAYMHNLLVQTDRGGSMGNYDGSSGILTTDPDMYDIDAHFNSESTWGSYVFLGGPGAG